VKILQGCEAATPELGILPGAGAQIENQKEPELSLRRLHTESGYGLRYGLWPTAVFTQARLAVSG